MCVMYSVRFWNIVNMSISCVRVDDVFLLVSSVVWSLQYDQVDSCLVLRKTGVRMMLGESSVQKGSRHSAEKRYHMS